MQKIVHLKELHLAKQSLYELETKEAKTGSIPLVEEITDILKIESLSLAVHLLPSVDPFAFSSFFSQLLNLLFYNTPQLFL